MATLLITGAARGIGRALVEEALKDGHNVFGSVRSSEDGRHLAASLGAGFHPLVFDVTDRKALKAAIAAIPGPIDILVNNAGTMGPKAGDQSTLSTDFDGFAETFAINTLGPLAVAQAVLPKMERSGHPAILSISTQMSGMGSAASDHIAYRASKVALNKVMQGLATDLFARGIPVLVIDPGWVKTDMGGAGAPLDPAEVARGILRLATGATMAMSGKFHLWSGEMRAW